MTTPLHQWLQEEKAAGLHESEGSFTLERSKAWEKLGAFQLPFPEAWCLKIVQAAHVHPSASLAVTQTSEENIFEFQGLPPLEWSELEPEVFSIDGQNDPFIEHLVVAVRALALQRSRPFSLSCEGGVVVWNGQDFQVLSQTSESGCFQLAVSNYEFEQSKSIFSLSRKLVTKYRAGIARTLAQRCQFSDSSLTLDRRKLSGFATDPFFGLTDRSYPLVALRADPIEGWDPMVVDVRLEAPDPRLGYHRVACAGPSDVGPQAFSTALLLSLQYEREVITETLRLERTVHRTAQGHSQIIWVRDGVVVDRESLDIEGNIALGLVVSAAGLESDLTSFSPLKNQRTRMRVARSLNLIAPLLSEWMGHLGANGLEVKGVDYRAGVSGVAGAAMMFAVPMVGAFFLARAGYDYYKSESLRKDFETSYNNGLYHLTEELKLKTEEFSRSTDAVR
jgi:hypothetical protein